MNKLNVIQQAQGLITYYQQKYKELFGELPGLLNRNTLKYPLVDALTDLTVDQFKQIIDYYLKIEAEPSLQKLLREYPDIWQHLQNDEKDNHQRKELRRETARRVQEFRERNQK